MRRTDHIASEDLLKYAEGQAEARLSERIRAHLATGCPACEQELAAWSRVVSCLEADRGEDVPEPVRQRAFAIFNPAPASVPLLERVLAVLVGDSRLQALPSPARTFTQAAPAWELLYEAQGVHIGLLCRHLHGVWQVAGQMLPDMPEMAGTAARKEMNWKIIADGPTGQQTADADEWNEFRLPELHPGTYILTLRSPRLEIVLPELELPD